MNILQLPLKINWFEMTKALIKTEDYRAITPYFCARLLKDNGKSRMEKWWKECYFDSCTTQQTIYKINLFAEFKEFDQNRMTHGYPKWNDLSKILDLKHNGIKIDTGNPDWGAEEGKCYFVIMHGDNLKKGK